MDSILFEKKGLVGWITLNRPEVFNSFNREMALALQKKLDECNEDTDIRAIVLMGEGKAFCAGQDLQEVVSEDGPDLPKIVAEHYNPIIRRIRSLQKPVISAVNGVAAGAGANIALACDICVACETAGFIQAFSKIGLIPDSAGTFFLPRLIGMQRAAGLMLTAEKVMALEAQEMGMIFKCFSEGSFLIETEKLASKLAKMPTKGLWFTKQLLNESMTNDLDTQLKREGELQTEASLTHDYKEGVQAFLEKRKPEFKGH